MCAEVKCLVRLPKIAAELNLKGCIKLASSWCSAFWGLCFMLHITFEIKGFNIMLWRWRDEGIAPHILSLGCGLWVVTSTFQPIYAQEKIPLARRGDWSCQDLLVKRKISATTGELHLHFLTCAHSHYTDRAIPIFWIT